MKKTFQLVSIFVLFFSLTAQKLTQSGGGDSSIAVIGGGAVAWVQLCSLTASASATLDFTAANCPSGVFSSTYHRYKFVLDNVLPASSANLQALVGTGGGPTFQATNYTCAGNLFNAGGSGGFCSGVTTIWQISGNAVLATAANGGISCEILLTNPQAAATVNPNIKGECDYWNSSGPTLTYSVVSGSWTASAALTAIRFQFPSINMTSGTITLYGVTP